MLQIKEIFVLILTSQSNYKMGANHDGYSRTIFFFFLFNYCLWFWGLTLYIFLIKKEQSRKSVTSSKLQLINTKKNTQKKWCSGSSELRSDLTLHESYTTVYTNIFSPTHCFVVSQIDCPAYARQNPDWSPDLSTFPDLIARSRRRCAYAHGSCHVETLPTGIAGFRTRAGRFAWWITGERRTRERAIYALNPDVHHKLILC